METTAGTSTTSSDEVDDLISMLRAWGINYLVGLEHHADSPRFEADQLSAVDLIQRLAQCNEYPRVRDATISLFLLHPELVDAAQQAMRESQPGVSEQIAVLVLATLYLQRLWILSPSPNSGNPMLVLLLAMEPSMYSTLISTASHSAK